MQIPIKLILLVFVIPSVVSCTPQMTRDLWNGVYSDSLAVKEAKSKREAYYANKSQEWRDLFKKNSYECNNLSERKYPPNAENSQEELIERQEWYKACLEGRGTPIL